MGPEDLRGVDRSIIEHKLSVDPRQKPCKLKVRKMSMELQLAARVEVQKLLDARVIQEVAYPEWLANPVLVKKSNDKWRMCFDFTLLNNACPKDDRPLALIDQTVDFMADC